MADDSGWIKLHRDILTSPIFQHDGLLRLWIHCLMRANWEPRKWLVPGTMKEIVVPRGSFITGRESLHASLYSKIDSNGNAIRREHIPTSRTLWRWLVALEEMECLTITTMSNRCSIVSVCKYEVYQSRQQSVVQPDVPHVSRTCPADVQHVSTIEERKNLRERNRPNFKKIAWVDDKDSIIKLYECISDASRDLPKAAKLDRAFKHKGITVYGRKFRKIDEEGKVIPVPDIPSKKPKATGYKMPVGFGERISVRNNIRYSSPNYVKPSNSKMVHQFTLDGVLIKTHLSVKDAAKHIGMGVQNFRHQIRDSPRQYCKGFIWKF